MAVASAGGNTTSRTLDGIHSLISVGEEPLRRVSGAHVWTARIQASAPSDHTRNTCIWRAILILLLSDFFARILLARYLRLTPNPEWTSGFNAYRTIAGLRDEEQRESRLFSRPIPVQP
jgi:hypothetical protein